MRRSQRPPLGGVSRGRRAALKKVIGVGIAAPLASTCAWAAGAQTSSEASSAEGLDRLVKALTAQLAASGLEIPDDLGVS